MRPQIISIEGNIGSGKSTLLEILRKHFVNETDIVFIKEPVEEWESIKNEENISMLKLFYEDPLKYSFPFQMMAGFTLLKAIMLAIQENPTAKLVITERSLQTTRYVFAQMLYDDKLIEDVNMQIYKLWFNTFGIDYLVNKIIYVNTNPNICHERISNRARVGENLISHEYLQNCHTYHTNMLEEIKLPTLVLDGSVEDITIFIDKITTFAYISW